MDTANSDLTSARGSSIGKTAEAPRIVSPSNHSSITGHHITLLGTAGAGISVEVLDWLTVVATVVADEGEQWSVTVPDVEPGDHLFLAYAIGTEGRRSSGSNAVAVSVSSDDEDPRPVRGAGLRKRISPAGRVGKTLRGLHRSRRSDDWSDDDASHDEWDRFVGAMPVTMSLGIVPPTTDATPSVRVRTETTPEQRMNNESATLVPNADRDPTLEAQKSPHTGRLALVETTEHRATRVTSEALIAWSRPSEIFTSAVTARSAPRESVVRSISAPHARAVPSEIPITENIMAHGVPGVLPVITPEPVPTEIFAALSPQRYDVVSVRAYSVPASRPVLRVHAVPLLSPHDRVPGWQRPFHLGFEVLTRHKRDRASMD